MTSSGTHTANTLKEIRRNIMADSSLFGDRLKPETEMPVSAGYSDLFMDASGADERESGSAGGAADIDISYSGETKVLENFRLGIEYIFEGYLLHYGESRLLRQDDGNFNLLAGDYMYARGLEAIAGLEDLACVEALAELVRLCSYIHCERQDPGLAAKAWAVTTLGLAARMSSIGRGPIGAASVSSGGAAPDSGIPAFAELDKLEDRLEELLSGSEIIVDDSGDSDTGPANRAPGLRERFSNIEADFFHKN
ncbi:MAG: hypothetical protein HZB44_02860 [Actinobacteria bacterium]|nr:hypothetical protein [Actinomycetota bacterium]